MTWSDEIAILEGYGVEVETQDPENGFIYCSYNGKSFSFDVQHSYIHVERGERYKTIYSPASDLINALNDWDDEQS